MIVPSSSVLSIKQLFSHAELTAVPGRGGVAGHRNGKSPTMRRTLLAGLAAGAAGTTALNAVSYLDMLGRARPASTTPEETAHRAEDALHLSLSAEGPDSDAAANRRTAIGALLGIAAGLAHRRRVRARAPAPGSRAVRRAGCRCGARRQRRHDGTDGAARRHRSAHVDGELVALRFLPAPGLRHGGGRIVRADVAIAEIGAQGSRRGQAQRVLARACRSVVRKA